MPLQCVQKLKRHGLCAVNKYISSIIKYSVVVKKMDSGVTLPELGPSSVTLGKYFASLGINFLTSNCR